ncbi:CCA tRNA nucleotidyltransferase [Kiritimatiella glycovorans]|uniref:tRNA adenylyltransferase n=1 Tax=Kiritimatiella glycovorans TaxID=1307763 RepID=A0A0G3EEY4_9BACT|nr:CCA tRNA nucleotidyltransferase [Kiritimatiella glycovorans]AKJ64878.1 tRNA adenylyltransferase [Kiritimatiella glycovorans]
MNEPTHPAYETALRVLATLREAGHKAWFAGGSVRDRLLGREAKDYDVATDALPSRVEELFSRTVAVGKSFGVIAVVEDDIQIEVTTFRSEDQYEDGRRPGSVTPTTPEEDAQRRDFTINGLFYDPVADRVIDYVGGREDLARGLVRAIGDPGERFGEDHLRMLRAVRFAATLEFEIETRTREAIRALAGRIDRISAERIEIELTRTLTESPRPGRALCTLLDTGLLAEVIPEAVPMVGQEQPPEFHPEGDVFTHTCLMLDRMGAGVKEPGVDRAELAWALLLHDVGKPPACVHSQWPDGRPRLRFDRHARISADMAEAVMRRLKMPAKRIRNVVTAIDRHMRFMHVEEMRESKLRRWMAEPVFPLELELHRLDCEGSHGDMSCYRRVMDLREKISREPVLPEPWVNGRDLIAMGLEPGPGIGELLDEAFERQLEGEAASREELLAWLRERVAQKSNQARKPD